MNQAVQDLEATKLGITETAAKESRPLTESESEEIARIDACLAANPEPIEAKTP